MSTQLALPNQPTIGRAWDPGFTTQKIAYILRPSTHITREMMESALPALNLYGRWVGHWYGAYEKVIVDSLEEALEMQAIPHFITGDPADTPIGEVQGAGAFHSFYNEYGAFAVTYSTLNGRQVPWGVFTERVLHEDGEVSLNRTVDLWWQFWNGVRWTVRWAEICDQFQGGGFAMDANGIVPLNTEEEIVVDVDEDGADVIEDNSTPNPDPCAQLVRRMEDPFATIFAPDFAMPWHNTPWSTDLRRGSFLRNAAPERFSDAVTLDAANRLSIPAGWISPQGYIGEWDLEGNINFVTSAQANANPQAGLVRNLTGTTTGGGTWSMRQHAFNAKDLLCLPECPANLSNPGSRVNRMISFAESRG